MKTRESQLNPKTQEIVKLLHVHTRVADIVRKGYSKSTVLYHKRKLFHPDKYERYLSRQVKYKKANDHPSGGDS